MDGVIDYTKRSKPKYPMTPEQRAMMLQPKKKPEEIKAELEASATPQYVITPGHQIEPHEFVKRNKTGDWSQQGTPGKLLTALDALGIEYKVGESVYFSGDTVAPVNIKVEGRQTPQTIGYQTKPGKNVVHHWIDFPFRGRRATLVGSRITWRNQEYAWDDFKQLLLEEE